MTLADHKGPGGILEPGRRPNAPIPNLATAQRRFCTHVDCMSSFDVHGRELAMERHEATAGHFVDREAVAAQRINVGHGRHGVWFRVDVTKSSEERDEDDDHAALCGAMENLLHNHEEELDKLAVRRTADRRHTVCEQVSFVIFFSYIISVNSSIRSRREFKSFSL